MSNTKFTPGPWTVEDIMDGEVKPENDFPENKGWKYMSGYIKSGVTIIAEVKAMQTHVFLHDFDQFEANAKLIAAAPDLLEVVKELYDWSIANNVRGSIFPKLEAAIKKATE